MTGSGCGPTTAGKVIELAASGANLAYCGAFFATPTLPTATEAAKCGWRNYCAVRIIEVWGGLTAVGESGTCFRQLVDRGHEGLELALNARLFRVLLISIGLLCLPFLRDAGYHAVVRQFSRFPLLPLYLINQIVLHGFIVFFLTGVPCSHRYLNPAEALKMAARRLRGLKSYLWPSWNDCGLVSQQSRVQFLAGTISSIIRELYHDTSRRKNNPRH
jgi:hypothetical protein